MHHQCIINSFTNINASSMHHQCIINNHQCINASMHHGLSTQTKPQPGRKEASSNTSSCGTDPNTNGKSCTMTIMRPLSNRSFFFAAPVALGERLQRESETARAGRAVANAGPSCGCKRQTAQRHRNKNERAETIQGMQVNMAQRHRTHVATAGTAPPRPCGSLHLPQRVLQLLLFLALLPQTTLQLVLFLALLFQSLLQLGVVFLMQTLLQLRHLQPPLPIRRVLPPQPPQEPQVLQRVLPRAAAHSHVMRRLLPRPVADSSAGALSLKHRVRRQAVRRPFRSRTGPGDRPRCWHNELVSCNRSFAGGRAATASAAAVDGMSQQETTRAW